MSESTAVCESKEKHVALEEKHIASEEKQIVSEEKQIVSEKKHVALEEKQVALEKKQIAEECQCPECTALRHVSVFNRTFWDLWIQKVFRNIASMKFQWLIFLYIPTIWGMFHLGPDNKSWISSVEGLAFLGGGFLTLATSRLLARTSLTESPSKTELDTEQ